MQSLPPAQRHGEPRIPGPRFLHLVTTQQSRACSSSTTDGGSGSWKMQGSWPRPPHPAGPGWEPRASLTLRPPCCFSAAHTFELRTRGHQNYVALMLKKLKIETHPAVQLLRLTLPYCRACFCPWLGNEYCICCLSKK